MTLACSVVIVLSTVFVCTRRSAAQRPTFVTAQMVLLNLFWVNFLIYFGLIWRVQENALRTLAGSPGWQQWWREQPFGFSEEFAALVDGMIVESVRAGVQTSWRGLTGAG